MTKRNMHSLLMQSIGKKSIVLIMVISSFASVDCSNKNNKRKPIPTRKIISQPQPQLLEQSQSQPQLLEQSQVATVTENDQYSKIVSEQPFDSAESVIPSVDMNVTPLEDGSGIKQVKTTVEPLPEEGKVVTTVETWTWQDAAKVAAIAAGTIGLGALAYMHKDQLANQFTHGYEEFNNWFNNANDTSEESTIGNLSLNDISNKVNDKVTVNNDISNKAKDKVTVTMNTPIKDYIPSLSDVIDYTKNTANQTVTNVQNLSLEKIQNASMKDIAPYGVGLLIAGDIGSSVGGVAGNAVGLTGGGIIGKVTGSPMSGAIKGANIVRPVGKIGGALAGAALVGTAISNYVASDSPTPTDATSK